MTKKCFKCLETKSFSEYYVHPMMQDGHLNKCKACTKKDVKDRINDLRQDPNWVDKERSRCRDKYYRFGYKGSINITAEDRRTVMKKFYDKYPEKSKAKNMSQRIKPKIKGNHMHHWSYNAEHYKDLIELSVSDHNKAHRYMVYDQERMMYRIANTLELLDTKDKHLAFIDSLKDKP